MESYLKRLKKLANDQKSLKKLHDNLLKRVNDLENQNKPQNVGNEEESNFENPFCFEQPLKKIKLEDQSEEIQKLNQVIKDLKNDNSKLSSENGKLSQANEDYKEAQKQNDKVVKNLKEELLKLARENADLKYGHAIQKSRF